MATMEVSSVPATGTNAIDALVFGTKWQFRDITYSFPVSGDDYVANYSSAEEPQQDFMPLTAAQQQGVTQALSMWAKVANLSFTQVPEPDLGGVLRFGQSSAPETAWAYLPSNQESGGDVWFGYQYDYTDPQWQTYGDYAFYSVVHEIGHTLGLKHPGNYSSSDAAPFLQASQDAVQNSVMSYLSYPGASMDTFPASDSYPQSPMAYDIQAVQYLYGPNYNPNPDGTDYVFSPTDEKIFRTIWDGSGTATYDASAYTTDVNINLAPGAWSTLSDNQLADLGRGVKAPGNVCNAFLYQGNTQSLIANAIGGSGDDTLNGNIGNNDLIGGDGSDQLYGAGGNDTLNGGPGDDAYWWGRGDGNVLITSDANMGLDILRMYSIQLGSYQASDQGGDLVLVASGGSTADLQDWYFQPAGNRIQSFVMSDHVAYGWDNGQGATINLYDAPYNNAIHAATAADTGPCFLRGTSAADTLTGSLGDDNLWGGTGGKDKLSGGGGSNAYWWDAACGDDTIVSTSSTDAMIFYASGFSDHTAGFTGADDLWFGSADGSGRATVQGWQNQNPADRLQGLVYDDSGTLDAYAWNGGAGAVVNLYDAAYAQAGVTTLTCLDPGNSILRGSAGNDVIIGGSGNDQIWGGGGNATLYGGQGSDVYWWDKTDGQSVIGYDPDNVNDSIQLAGLNRADLTAVLSGNDLVMAAGASSLTIRDWQDSELNGIRFADGSSGTLTSLLGVLSVSQNGKMNGNAGL